MSGESSPVRPVAAFFDLDGTLMDREPLMEAAIQRAARGAGLEFAPGETNVLVGRAWQDVHRALRIDERLGWDLDTFLAHTLGAADDLVAAGFETTILPGGRELIERLDRHGVAVMVVTGSLRREADIAIDHLDIGGHLRGSLAAEDYAVGKPAPDCYLDAARTLGLDPTQDGGRCVVFEDSTPGVMSGVAAGMRVVATEAANRPAGHPSWQDLSAAHVIVPGLDHVTDDVLVSVLRP